MKKGTPVSRAGGTDKSMTVKTHDDGIDQPCEDVHAKNGTTTAIWTPSRIGQRRQHIVIEYSLQNIVRATRRKICPVGPLGCGKR